MQRNGRWWNNMRDKFIYELLKEVLGPRDGSEETLLEDPYDEYLTGVIVPWKWHGKDVEADDAEPVAGGGVSDDDASDTYIVSTFSSALDPLSKPGSMGISFRLGGVDPSMDLCVTWGRYQHLEDTEDGGWKRASNRAIIGVKLDEVGDRTYKPYSVYSEDDGEIYLAIRKDVVGEYTSVTVKLINDLQPEGKNKPHTSCCIFQPSIRIKLADGTFAAPEKKEYSESEEDMTLQFLYRERLSLARGHMCAAFWRDVDPEESGVDFPSLWVDGVTHKDCHEFEAPDFRTEFVPVYAMPSPDFEWQSEYGAAPDLSAAKLSEIWNDDEIDEHLLPMYESYLKWAEKNNEITDSFSDDELRAARKIVDFQKKACERILSGINLIKKDKNVRLSFCFANRVIWLQNHWKKKTDDFGWRPFQLAFFLMNIEPLFNENSEYRNVADLLWIPTGGGKTEAYLAIMAFTMALRRRKALASSTSSVNMTGGGTTVISRYTLRLLTVQQFRRTIQMVTAAEYLRVQTVHEKIGWRPEKCDITDDFILGSMRFSAGLWVGIGVTPNKLRGDRGAIKALRGGAKDAGEPAQLTTCPVCGGWLSIPNEGITERKLTIHIVFKTDADVDSVEQFFRTLEVKDDTVEVEGIKVTAESHSAGYMTASFSMSGQRDDLKPENVEKLWGDVSGKADENGIKLEIASFRSSRPGYFPVMEPKSKNTAREGDFEIYCPNPECDLNRGVHWKEGVPLNVDPEDRGELPDGLYLKKTETPFIESARIPIPACIVDEQVYRRCPTVIVGTADKIARLAFEPRVASMFGNVEKYSSCYGYYRDDLLPKDPNATTKRCKEERMITSVLPFSPPDLIVQDELHLIDGPLGSMFGLYETAVGALCSSGDRVPRYIASTATIKHAESQIQSLFTRDMFQFPPHGMEIEDSFFVHYPSGEQAWDETHPGRVYMGICAPGRGAHTPLIRIWSRILKTGNDLRGMKHAGNFWTLVGYFNAIRELGGALALYRQDIVERLEHLRKISGGSDTREIDQSRIVELSSRIESTHLPSILKELETLKTPVEKNPDAIFATSMFGTGVDIPHLSLMAVQGQPKTTSAYIQATGRVGRKYSAPVITFLRASRPRDMSHYEMFTRYHHRIYLDVEPVSVSPFSEGALRRASGPVAVAFLRNMRDAHVRWWSDAGDVVIDADSELDVQQINDLFENRFSKLPESLVKQGKTSQEIREDIKRQIEWWKTIAKQSGTSLRFNEYTMYGHPEKDVVLGDPVHKHAGKKFVYENAPQSLRDVEETTGFEVGRPEKVQHIRRSQFVTTYGPGAIIEGRQGPRVILTIDRGLTKRFNQETLEKFEILDMRMAKLVANARIFALPTKESEKVPQNYYIYRTKEFPVWRICTDTKKHKTSVLYNGGNKGGKCPECSNVGEPVRFILACPDGHMDDIPWNPAVHGKEHGIKCCGWFYWRGGGSSVRSIEIECPTCHKKTTMGAIYARGWRCTGRSPEQEHPDSPQGGREKCSSTMKIIQRQATNLRIPEILTLLTIPKYDTPIVKVIQERGVYEIFRVLEDLEELDEEHFRKLINKKIESSTVLKESGELIDKYISDNGWEQFLKLYRDLLPKDGEYRDMLRDMLIEEFRSLQNASENDYTSESGNFSIKKLKKIPVDLPPGRLTFGVAGIELLRTVTVQKGYTRMPYMKSEGEPESNRMISVAAKEHDSGDKWLPGVESLGEGIFITSSENPLNPSIPAVNEWGATKTNSTDEDTRNRDPLFVWWHTLSHALIRTLSLYSGYSSSALRERVYLDDSEGQKQGGILIYTVMSGEDGGMGGLTGTVAGFGDILTNAIKSISLCSNDPLCIEQRITEKNCNGAACHSCLLISETSCEHRNMWLDRHLILGDNEFS
jgi:hypothetical protein